MIVLLVAPAAERANVTVCQTILLLAPSFFFSPPQNSPNFRFLLVGGGKSARVREQCAPVAIATTWFRLTQPATLRALKQVTTTVTSASASGK